MDSQIDHTTGLTLMREGAPLDVYCTRQVHEDLTTGVYSCITSMATLNEDLQIYVKIWKAL